MIIISTAVYESPLSSRYASDEMLYLFSPDKKFTTWRRLWIALARAEMNLGLPITQQQIDEMEAHNDDINYDARPGGGKAPPPRRHGPCPRLRSSSAPVPRASSIWAPPAATWATTPTCMLMREGPGAHPRQRLVNVLAALSDFADRVQGPAHPGLYPLSSPLSSPPWASAPPSGCNELLMDLDELELPDRPP